MQKRTNILTLITACLLSFCSSCQNSSLNDSGGLSDDHTANNDINQDIQALIPWTLNDAITIGNLQVFLLKGEVNNSHEYVTLDQAIKKGLVQVNETGSVNSLSIENKSDQFVFIHSGDIVKGGKQDRTIAHDVIVAPNSKNVALESFCVEQQRWSQRSGEKVAVFESNSKMLSSRKLKLAARYEGNQGSVWHNVAQEQNQLKRNVSKKQGKDVEVISEKSQSSLQLTLESEELKKVKNEYDEALKDLLKRYPNAIGYAYAINGEVMGVDVYNNHQLFSDLWYKIAESISTEAISLMNDESFDLSTKKDVRSFVSAVDNQKTSSSNKAINKFTQLKMEENEEGYLYFNTIDQKKSEWVHKNYMKKDETQQKAGRSSSSSEINQRINVIEQQNQLLDE